MSYSHCDGRMYVRAYVCTLVLSVNENSELLEIISSWDLGNGLLDPGENTRYCSVFWELCIMRWGTVKNACLVSPSLSFCLSVSLLLLAHQTDFCLCVQGRCWSEEQVCCHGNQGSEYLLSLVMASRLPLDRSSVQAVLLLLSVQLWKSPWTGLACCCHTAGFWWLTHSFCSISVQQIENSVVL